MPFVMLCGLPSSGKTHYANLIKKYLTETCQKNVVSLTDSMYCQDKNSVYMGMKPCHIHSSLSLSCNISLLILDSNKEKELRASLKSDVQKLMSKEDIVILDSLNYIKGYRYELFCVSKLCQTPQCVVSLYIVSIFKLIL